MGERQSTLRGYNAAVRAAEDVGWIGRTVQQLHKRIAQAASKVGLQRYLPPEGLCVLVERAELQPGALPMACWAVLSWVLWLGVGEVSLVRMGDEAGSEPRGHLGVTWGVYLCAGKPPLADIILFRPPELTRCDSVIGLAIPAMSGHIQYRGAASGDLYIRISGINRILLS